jgi:hypothetical protein
MLEHRLAPANLYHVTLFTDNSWNGLGGPGTGPGQMDPGDPTGMSGDLRWAINQALLNPGSTVDFGQPLGLGGGGPPPAPPPTQTISLLAPLPIITVPMTIDGTSYPGFAGTPPIQLDGTNVASAFPPPGPASVTGLSIQAANVVIKGLVIDNFSGDGIDLLQGAQDTVTECYIGTDLTGKIAKPNGGDGIDIFSQNNTIGGATTSQGNVISGNGGDGIRIMQGGLNNSVFANAIGTDVTGAAALPNGGNGVHILGGGSNHIGDSNVNPVVNPGSWNGNVISGNKLDGVRIESFAQGNDIYQPANNTVAENAIGTDDTGTFAIPNQGNGVSIVNGADNVVGSGVGLANPNVISGNAQNGVSISGNLATGNTVTGNLIGVTLAGNQALKNNMVGVLISNQASSNMVGAGNVISGNGNAGVDITGDGTSNNTVAANYIGTDSGGTVAIPNNVGVQIDTSASNNTIGGAGASAGNIISGNTGDGVYITGGGQPLPLAVPKNNTIQGNWIGVDSSGKKALGNTNNGIELSAAAGTIVASNVISANGTGTVPTGSDGICIVGGTSSTQIWGNYIGLGSDGTTQLGNKNDGIYVQARCGNNSVGLAGQAFNYISANGNWGVEDDTAAPGAGGDPAIVRNVIGYDTTGANAFNGDPTAKTGGGYYSASGTAPGAGNTIQPGW